MGKSLIIAEEAHLAALMDKGKAIEFFLQNNDFSLGEIYAARVENILPSIDAVFVNLGMDKMGFLHASDIPGNGPLADRVWPRQKLLVQIVKEPTSNKGPRVSTDITLIGRFFVLTTEHNNIVMSRRINSANERARLKSIASLLKPPIGFGLVVRTEAMGTTERELEEDFRQLFMERWKFVIDQFEIQRQPRLLLSDSRDLLFRVLRDVFHNGISEVLVDNPEAEERANYYLNLWSNNPPKVIGLKTKELLIQSNVLAELKEALSSRIELPSGGYVYIQPTEALMVIDVNSGKFTSSSTPSETVLKTNLEAGTEIARQLRLRNIGGVIVIDFIDMESKLDRLKLLEHFEKLLENDPAHPQIGRLSDLGLVELTRHRQEKSLFEALGSQCDKCHGSGWVFPIFDLYEDKPNKNPQIQQNIQNLPINNYKNNQEDLDLSNNFNEENAEKFPQKDYEENNNLNNSADQLHQSESEQAYNPRSPHNRSRHNNNPRRNQPYERPDRNNRNLRQARPHHNRHERQTEIHSTYRKNDNPENSNRLSNSDLENQLVSPASNFPIVQTTVSDFESIIPVPEKLMLDIPVQDTLPVPVLPILENTDKPKPKDKTPVKETFIPEVIEKNIIEEEIKLPTFSLKENVTKEVLPGIYSFDMD